MYRTDAAGNVNGMYDNGDPLLPREATFIDADHLNAIQEEIVGVVLASGATLNKADNTQLLTALNLMYSRLGKINTWTERNTFNVDGLGWQDIPLNTSGGWFASSNTTVNQTPQYRIDSFGRCWLRGLAFRSGTSIIIGTLPTEAAPPTSQCGPFIVDSTHASGQSKIIVYGVNANAPAAPGMIYIQTNDASSIRLDGIAFYVNGK
jgi:hypothetical protein